MSNQFGNRIRILRTAQGLLLRQVAPNLDVDTALLSKIERGERPVKKEQIPILAEMLKGDKEELLTLWLADQVMNIVGNERFALQAIQVVEKEIKYNKKEA